MSIYTITGNSQNYVEKHCRGTVNCTRVIETILSQSCLNQYLYKVVCKPFCMEFVKHERLEESVGASQIEKLTFFFFLTDEILRVSLKNESFSIFSQNFLKMFFSF